VPKKNLKKFWKLPNANGDSPTKESSTVRWDEYSGEPTDSAKGKPPSTTPGAVRSHEDPSSPGRLTNNFGTSTHISGGAVPARKRVGTRELSDAPIIMRPEWKGAGGRQVIVKPLMDKPLATGRTPQYPTGSHKLQQEQQERDRMAQAKRDEELIEQQRVNRETAEREREQLGIEQERAKKGQQETDAAETESKARERVEKARQHRDKAQLDQHCSYASRLRSPDSTSSARSMTLQPSIQVDIQAANHPINGSLLENNVNLENSTPTMPQPSAQFRHASLTSEDRRSPLARNPSIEEMKLRRDQALPDLPKSADEEKPSRQKVVLDEQSWQVLPESMPRVSPVVRDSSLIETRFRADLQQMYLHDEPASRFSTTTCATTVCDSPPLTPEMGSNTPSATSTPNSILNRKRPIAPAGISNAKATARKPTPSEIPILTPMSQNNRSSKSLPKPPPDAQVVSPVQSLQAKQDVLRRRRYNLETVIHELTHVVQPSSIAYDVASRQEIKKTVEGLNKELAEVIKDEHETGLKLHRAWKRHEDFAQYEPTSIWVRRVTS